MGGDLTELPRFEDRLSHLYLDTGRIEQKDKSVACYSLDQCTPIPVADLALLMLGPGTTITHAAVHALADANCMVIWCGEEGVRFYSHGRGGTHLSSNLMRQARLWANQRTHRLIVRRMYQMRFQEVVDPSLTIEQVRGREGYRVRRAYEAAAAKFQVPWKKRAYDPNQWSKGDPLNRALSAGSACLNGLVQAAIVTAGYSTGLGFIHTGKALSFVYDIADLYKVDCIVPLAFGVVAESPENVERRVRIECRNLFGQRGLLRKILPDIEEVFHVVDDPGEGSPESEGGTEQVDDRAEGRDLPWSHDRESA